MKSIIIAFVFLVVIGCAQEPIAITYEGGVTRELPGSVPAGGEAEVTLHIRLLEGQTFYIIEEVVPEGVTTTAETDANNHVKLVNLEASGAEEYTYTITAPDQPGTYVFAGNYAVEGMEEAAAIKGSTLLNVK